MVLPWTMGSSVGVEKTFFVRAAPGIRSPGVATGKLLSFHVGFGLKKQIRCDQVEHNHDLLKFCLIKINRRAYAFLPIMKNPCVKIVKSHEAKK